MNLRALCIIVCTADYFGLSAADLLGRDRHKTVAWARQLAMALVRQRLALSYPEIGRVFNRDHSTVIHNVRNARVCLGISQIWSDAAAAIERQLDGTKVCNA